MHSFERLLVIDHFSKAILSSIASLLCVCRRFDIKRFSHSRPTENQSP